MLQFLGATERPVRDARTDAGWGEFLLALQSAANRRVLGVFGAGRRARAKMPSKLSPESKMYKICWCFAALGPFVR
jgi:hypothetical protein